jgi:hypothetical protein
MPSFTLRRHLWPNRSRQRHRRERALANPAAAIEAADIDATPSVVSQQPAHKPPRQRKAHKKSVRLRIDHF